jgi:hypothetical protein
MKAERNTLPIDFFVAVDIRAETCYNNGRSQDWSWENAQYFLLIMFI